MQLHSEDKLPGHDRHFLLDDIQISYTGILIQMNLIL